MSDKEKINIVEARKNIDLERKAIDFLVNLGEQDFNRVLEKINRLRKSLLESKSWYKAIT